jgi:hypothetical protein
VDAGVHVTEQKKKTTYCRACGENKGHSFHECKNISGLRSIIKSQDLEIDGYLGRLKQEEERSKLLSQLQTNYDFLTRNSLALLDLVEFYRASGSVKR